MKLWSCRELFMDACRVKLNLEKMSDLAAREFLLVKLGGRYAVFFRTSSCMLALSACSFNWALSAYSSLAKFTALSTF